MFERKRIFTQVLLKYIWSKEKKQSSGEGEKIYQTMVYKTILRHPYILYIAIYIFLMRKEPDPGFQLTEPDPAPVKNFRIFTSHHCKKKTLSHSAKSIAVFFV